MYIHMIDNFLTWFKMVEKVTVYQWMKNVLQLIKLKSESIGIYMLQLNLTKLNLDLSQSVRRILQSLMVKTFLCSGSFAACMNAPFPLLKLGYTKCMTHCGMVPNGVANLVELQLTSLRRTEVLAYSFDTVFNYALWPMLTIIYVIRGMESVISLHNLLRFYIFQRY